MAESKHALHIFILLHINDGNATLMDRKEGVGRAGLRNAVKSSLTDSSREHQIAAFALKPIKNQNE